VFEEEAILAEVQEHNMQIIAIIKVEEADLIILVLISQILQVYRKATVK
jgi:hypothetical protein